MFHLVEERPINADIQQVKTGDKGGMKLPHVYSFFFSRGHETF